MNQEKSDPAGDTRDQGTLLEVIADGLAIPESLSSSRFDRRILADLLFLLVEKGILESDEVRRLISNAAAEMIKNHEQAFLESESLDTKFRDRMVKMTEKMSTDLLNRFDS